MLLFSALSACHAPPAGPGPAPAPSVDCEAIAGDGTTFYEDNPTYRDLADHALPEAAPEDEGMDSALLESAADAVGERPFALSFLVLRHGSLVLERYFHGSDPTASDNVHSASKSILAAAIGVAVGEGALGLDDRVADLLPAEDAALLTGDKADIAVRHLLTMTPGLSWREDVTEYQIEARPDWVAAILERDLDFPVGAHFLYSTGDTHVLSAVLTTATGESTCAYVHRALFDPLGITAEHWGRDPQGYYSGGYNLYLTARELARFGLLVLRDGEDDGRQVVPAGYLADAATEKVDTGGGYGYGHGFWTTDVSGHPTSIAWGWGGQLVYVVPDVDLVVVVTTNTRDYGVDYDAEAVLEDYVLPAIVDGSAGRRASAAREVR